MRLRGKFPSPVACSADDLELPGGDPRGDHVQLYPAHPVARADPTDGDGVLDRVVRPLGRETPRMAHRR